MIHNLAMGWICKKGHNLEKLHAGGELVVISYYTHFVVENHCWSSST
jgi:hypothetical protein